MRMQKSSKLMQMTWSTVADMFVQKPRSLCRSPLYEDLASSIDGDNMLTIL